MDRKEDGGPAFPRTGATVDARPQIGMTLRDYLAAHAPAMTDQWFEDSRQEGETWMQVESAWRYAYADAMIAERAK